MFFRLPNANGKGLLHLIVLQELGRGQYKRLIGIMPNVPGNKHRPAGLSIGLGKDEPGSDGRAWGAGKACACWVCKGSWAVSGLAALLSAVMSRWIVSSMARFTNALNDSLRVLAWAWSLDMRPLGIVNICLS